MTAEVAFKLMTIASDPTLQNVLRAWHCCRICVEDDDIYFRNPPLQPTMVDLTWKLNAGLWPILDTQYPKKRCLKTLNL